jgi:error-prone DNA polymerase
MANRSVLQWDKDDSAAVGLVKFDLLGLGMLTMLHIAHDLVREVAGIDIDLAAIPQEQEVYDMLCVADTVGVFQVESRAQMATLPRLKPRTFYDLVVEVALIRPGPIQGGSVHPYLRRRDGLEPVTYLHPLLEGALAKTLGVPLFQEQLMQIAVDVAGFTPAEADRLRQAMGAKRSQERMGVLKQRFFEGARQRGVPTDDVIDQIWQKLQAFANFGFPESHSVSFAYLVYASAWYKLRWPAAFCAALINAQPMGFWSPATICADARRHGVEVRRPDVNTSLATTSLAPCAQKLPLRSETPAMRQQLSARKSDEFAVQLGLHQVRDLGDELAKRIETERLAHGPFSGPDDLARRCEVGSRPLEALATAGAFASCGIDRRAALWAAGPAAQAARGNTLAGTSIGVVAPQLPGLSDVEVMAHDLWATGISTDSHPMAHLRPFLADRRVVLAASLTEAANDSRVVVAGIVTHRQRPATAQGTTFLNLEDETGLINVICSKGCWARYRRVTTDAPALIIRGRLERSGLVVNIVAEKIEALDLVLELPRSRDFR